MSALPFPSLFCAHDRDATPMLEHTMSQWGGSEDLWVFGYGSLIWRPDFAFSERRTAHVHGWHRALKMWSTINRGTPQCPGLVFGMLSGGSCHGMAFRVAQTDAPAVLKQLWQREMPNAVYDPRWLPCKTAHGTVKALAFTLSRQSPHHTGELPPEEYRRIFAQAQGIYGTTRDYAQATFDELQRMGIRDKALQKLLSYAAN
ncbi:gamma-glutamylcyclotransferase [Comamonas aquatilis]|uniref:gamma-glutamylcyclotransferase n=1 Tax=Comamonas aquatilis TaxID=1778406 RepID=UPI0039F09A1C